MLKRRLKEPFGKAGLTVAVFALVLAMVGGAYAAGALSGKQKKEVEKIAQKFAGKPGAAGANGSNGTNGAPGKEGAAGAPGTSVAGSTEPKGTNCKEGGSKFVAGASTTFACNGVAGKEGSPWTAGGTLPSGKTEEGTWAVIGAPPGELRAASVSFPIPLAAPAEAEYVTTPTNAGGCPGSLKEPKAEPGHFCVYVYFSEMTFIQFLTMENVEPAASAKFGALIDFNNEGTEPGSAMGSWAVTAK